jgi:hypothetical protein
MCCAAQLATVVKDSTAALTRGLLCCPCKLLGCCNGMPPGSVERILGSNLDIEGYLLEGCLDRYLWGVSEYPGITTPEPPYFDKVNLV